MSRLEVSYNASLLQYNVKHVLAGLDFGLAIDESIEVSNTHCGSLVYAAPELLHSDVDAYDGKKADIWSL